MNPPPDAADDFVQQFKKSFIPLMMAKIDSRLIDLESGDETALKKRIEEIFEEKMKQDGLSISAPLRTRLLKEILLEIIG